MGNQSHSRQASVLPTFPGCFVCGEENKRGLQTRFFSEGCKAKAVFTPDQTLIGYEDTVHGGIICALLDEAMIWACYVSQGYYGITAEINVRFIKSLEIERQYVIIGNMLEDKGRLWIAESFIEDENEKDYAKAVGKVIPIHKDQTPLHMKA